MTAKAPHENFDLKKDRAAWKAKAERMSAALKDIMDEAKLHGDECWWQDIRATCRYGLAPEGEKA